jgi:hypothetical protein
MFSPKSSRRSAAAVVIVAVLSVSADPDTGMSCRNFGGVAVCDPPQGTVHYRNHEGLNCTRTGIVSVCSSF